MTSETAAFLSMLLVAWVSGTAAVQAQAPSLRDGIPAEEHERIQAAVPAKARVAPEKPRRLLVFSRSWGYAHSAIPYGRVAIEAMARRTGAFEAVLTDELELFEKESLAGFDAIVFNNTNNEIFLPQNLAALSEEERRLAEVIDARLKKNLVEYLKGGGGLAVLHAGVASFRKWPEFGELMGARFENHPWGAGSTVTLKVEEPDHPLAAAFGGESSFTISDEIYQLADPFSREEARVLLSVDLERTEVTPGQRSAFRRQDGDFPITYVKGYGEGRVFYCALGHQHDLFWNPVVLQHYMDGIQFALGDLEADMTPTAGPALSWSQSEDRIALLSGGQEVWRLNLDRERGKAYFHPVGLLDGTPLTWLSPPDHVWHRALWFSWKLIDGVNYWEDGPEMGLTRLVSIEEKLSPDHSARIDLDVDWHPPGEPPVLREKRALAISAPDGEGRYAIDWRATFTALGEDRVLDRTPPPGEPGGVGHGGYAGMSVRVAKETRDWRIMDSEGRAGMECHRQGARWIAGDFVHTGAEVEAGIAILDHPENPRHPAPSFIVLTEAMPFVYYSPALLFDAPLTLPAGESLTLRYRVLVQPGRFDREWLDGQWEAFAASEGADQGER